LNRSRKRKHGKQKRSKRGGDAAFLLGGGLAVGDTRGRRHLNSRRA
jgi:hypothetical protein